ncbi:MAG TPA: single-stranded DNA-binding protein [Acidimicrobiales bacterium]|jgi:single-strand DNA-binding protein|nr:single-stranded DNA-binding protein [Acidimicrobiales bacterium]
MARNINTITVSGNVTRDPELRFTPSGQGVCSFSVAVNRSWQNRQTQEWEEQTSFFDVKAWGQLGQNISDTLSKGARVVVSGRLEQRSWETEQGEKRYAFEIVADDVAVSLLYATAEISKNERREGEGGGFSGGGGGGASRPQPSNAAPANYDPAEEPF